MYHGRSGTGEQFLQISGWREQADAVGLVAVFPTGLRYRSLETGRLETGWNKFGFEDEVDLNVRPDGYPPAPAPWPADDVGFTDAMVNDLRAKLPIDTHRVYASGFSNGSGMTARLAVERSTTFAAAAVLRRRAARSCRHRRGTSRCTRRSATSTGRSSSTPGRRR